MNRICWVLALIAAGAVGARAAELWNNGPIVTGTHSNGVNQLSQAQNIELNASAAKNSVAGLNMSNTGFQAGDDFVVPDGQTWTLNQLKVYGYQTTATANTFTGLFVRIYDVTPVDNNTVPIWGDFTTNRYVSGTMTGIYRTFAGDTAGTTRPVVEVAANVSTAPKLGPGHYWVVWGATGSLSSGPWVVPITPSPVGANGVQRPDNTGVYQPARSEYTNNGVGTGTYLNYDLAFKLDGERNTNLAVFLMQKTGSRYWGYFNTNNGMFTSWNRVMNSGVAADWSIKAFGDFNNDGHKDALLRYGPTGRLAVWTLNAPMITGWSHLMNLPTSMNVVGAGDFDGDGFADVLVQDPTSRAMGFYPVTAGFTVGAMVPLSMTPDAGTHPVAVGDMSGDGMPDVLFDNGKGRLGFWTVTAGGTVSAWTLVSYTHPNWSVVGLGDVNLDGTNDIIVYVVSTSRVGAFLMNGTTVQNYQNIGIVDLGASDLLGVAHP